MNGIFVVSWSLLTPLIIHYFICNLLAYYHYFFVNLLINVSFGRFSLIFMHIIDSISYFIHQLPTSSIINDEDKTMNPRKYYIKLNGIMIDDPAEAVLETDISWYN